MNLKKLAGKAHTINVSKGFWDPIPNEGQTLWLVCTEMCEMTEAHREGRDGDINKFEKERRRIMNSRYSDHEKPVVIAKLFKKHVKDSMGDELADSLIRMLDYCVGFKITIEEKKIGRIIEQMKNRKLKNLGEELLDLAGLIKFLHKGIVKAQSANAVIARIILFGEQLQVPLMKHVKYKLEYNATRPRKHNKKY